MNALKVKKTVEKILKDLDCNSPLPLPDSAVNSISILLTSDDEVRELNHNFRGLNKTTDVLSFSMIEGVVLETGQLGDLIISLEQTLKQSKRFKCTPNEELLRLLIHGCLHLFGFDHVKVSAKKKMQMRSEEDRLLKMFTQTELKMIKCLPKLVAGKTS